MAKILRKLRSGRAAILPQNICRRENGPSYVSVIVSFRRVTLSLGFDGRQKLPALPHCKSSAESLRKYFCHVKFSTQVLISLWKTPLARRLTSSVATLLSTLHYFCAIALLHASALTSRRKQFPAMLPSKETVSHQRPCATTTGSASAKSILPKLFSLVPLDGLFEVHFQRLLGIRHFEQSSVGLPSLRHYLHQHFSHRRIRNVRRSFAIGLHVQLKLLVLDQVFFHVLHIHAGILDRRVLLPAAHFNREPRRGLRSWRRSFRGRCRLALCTCRKTHCR